MAEIADDRMYTKDHEWALVDPTEPGVVSIGISDYAQDKLGDIVMVELPEVGDAVAAESPIGTVESPKSVSDIFAPLAGTVVGVNEALEDEPELVNQSPYDKGWMVRLELADPSAVDALMDSGAYRALLAALDEG